MRELIVETNKKEEIVDITTYVADIVEKLGVDSGICTLFVPHTTCGVTINENADPFVKHDILLGLGSIVKRDFRFKHAEGNSIAHIKSMLVGTSVIVPVKDGRIALGTWQGIYFCEFDGSRKRTVWVLVK